MAKISLNEMDPTTARADIHAREVIGKLRWLPGYRIDPLVALADNAVRAVASRRGVPIPIWTLGAEDLPDELDHILSEEKDWLDTTSVELFPTYIPSLARALAATNRIGAPEQITSSALVEVITTIVSARSPESLERPISIYDPAAGTGTLLVAVAQSLGGQVANVSGQDVDARMPLIASANAFLAGVDGQFVLHDALETDGFSNERFDFTVSDPPVGLNWSRLADSLRLDPRYGGGLPAQRDASLLFAQILVSKLRLPEDGGGRAVILCAPHPLYEGSGSQIRDWLLQEDLLEAIVALPEGLSSVTNVRLFALVLNNAKAAGWLSKVQVVDLRGSFVDAPRTRPERRRLSEVGLGQLREAIERPRPSAVARPVSLDQFRFNVVDANHAAVFRRAGGGSRTAALSLRVPRVGPLEQWAQDRYGAGLMPQLSVQENSDIVEFEISSVFPDPVDRQARSEINRQNWPQTRLICLASGFGFIRSAKAADRDAEIAVFPPGILYLAIPVEPQHNAVVIEESLEAAPDSRCFIVESDGEELAELAFLAAWLNSPGGQAVRRPALMQVQRGASLSQRSFSRNQIMQFLDEVVVPLPNRRLQREIALTTATIASTALAVSAAERDLWQNPNELGRLRRRVQLSGEAEGLTEWAGRLPYPLASALWVYESDKHNPLHAERHLLRFWEAVAEFLATMFLSVLDGDPVLRASEFASLHEALSKVHQSLERASFGTWVTIVQRLAATFRKQLNSEGPDVAEKLLSLFCEPSAEVLKSLLSPEIGRLLSTVNGLRNDWIGHGGATTEVQADEHLRILLGHTEELRNLLSPVWEQYRLVRAGRMGLREGRYRVDVELASGTTAHFRRKPIVLSEPLIEDRLYLTVRDGERALLLNDLILLRPTSDPASNTCYFYSRREGAGFRMVTFQYADENFVVEDVLGIRELLSDFADQSG